MSVFSEILVATAENRGYSVSPVSVVGEGRKVTISGKDIFWSGLEERGTSDEIFKRVSEKLAGI